MTFRFKCGIALLGGAVLSIAGVAVHRVTKPMEQQILAAGHIELTEKASYWDGGSRDFVFRLPYSASMVVFVPHRHPAFGGNPDFQEIWLRPAMHSKRRVKLEPGSALEKKLVGLLQTATIPRDKMDATSVWAPSSYDLKWLADRIQDRKSSW